MVVTVSAMMKGMRQSGASQRAPRYTWQPIPLALMAGFLLLSVALAGRSFGPVQQAGWWIVAVCLIPVGIGLLLLVRRRRSRNASR